MILSVPLPMPGPQIVADGVVGTDHVRVHIASHIIVAHIDTSQAHLHRQPLQRTVVHRLPVGVALLLRTILGIAHHIIIAELIAAVQEVHQLLCLATDIRIVSRLCHHLWRSTSLLLTYRSFADGQGKGLQIDIRRGVEGHAETTAQGHLFLTDSLWQHHLIEG